MLYDSFINSPYNKFVEDMQRQQQLYAPSGIVAMMEEQRRMWEIAHPYSVREKHLEEINKINKQYHELMGVAGIVASAMEDYRIKFERDYSSISRSLKSLIPESRFNLDGIHDRLSNIYKLEESFKRALDINKFEYVLPSQRIINSFAGIAATCSNLQYENPLASLSLYNSLPYHEYVHKQLLKIARDIPSIATRRAIVTELSGSIYEASEIATEIGGNVFNDVEISLDSDQLDNNQANIFNTTNCHIGYIYNSNNNIDTEKAYYNSVPIKISQLGCMIVEKIYSINEFSFRKNNSTIFATTNKSQRASSRLATTIASNEALFAEIIDCLYYMIYEGSGAANRVRTIIDDESLNPLWCVKHLRLEFSHDVEHGDKKIIVEKFNKIGDAYKSLIGFERPRSQKEWINAQLMLYMRLLTMLESIHNKQ